MSLRLKLLLLGLLTLVLPWAGCRYAREMESALREGEQNSLQAVAQTIAASLQGRTDLLYRAAPPPASPAPDNANAAAQPGAAQDPDTASEATSATSDTAHTRDMALATDPEPPHPGPYDLQPLLLSAAPLL